MPPGFEPVWERDGCQRWRGRAATGLVAELVAICPSPRRAGTRLAIGSPFVERALGAMAIVAAACCDGARPVRAVLFDKSSACNWAVPWHQDRTIAVSGRADHPGYGPWSVKDGIAHVEPPFAMLAAMVTLRLHLDRCDEDNAPLQVALGSHLARVDAGAAADTARRYRQYDCIADAGDVWAYATPILHGSVRAARPSRRRVLQVDFSAATMPAGLCWAG